MTSWNFYRWLPDQYEAPKDLESVNINRRVLVRITEEWEKLIRLYAESEGKNYTWILRDTNGYTEMCIWEIAYYFWKRMGVGLSPLIEDNTMFLLPDSNDDTATLAVKKIRNKYAWIPWIDEAMQKA